MGHKYGAQLDSGQYAKLTNGAKSTSRWSTVACQVGFWNLATSHSNLGPLGLTSDQKLRDGLEAS